MAAHAPQAGSTTSRPNSYSFRDAAMTTRSIACLSIFAGSALGRSATHRIVVIPEPEFDLSSGQPKFSNSHRVPAGSHTRGSSESRSNSECWTSQQRQALLWNDK